MYFGLRKQGRIAELNDNISIFLQNQTIYFLLSLCQHTVQKPFLISFRAILLLFLELVLSATISTPCLSWTPKSSRTFPAKKNLQVDCGEKFAALKGTWLNGLLTSNLSVRVCFYPPSAMIYSISRTLKHFYDISCCAIRMAISVLGVLKVHTFLQSRLFSVANFEYPSFLTPTPSDVSSATVE